MSWLRGCRQYIPQNKIYNLLHCSVTKQFLLVLCALRCSLVSEWVYWSNLSLFFCFRVNTISNLRAAMIIRIFHLIIYYQEFGFSLLISQNFNPFYLEEECWEAYCNPNRHCSTQFRVNFLYTKIACFVGSYFFGGRNENAWTLPSVKTRNSLATFISASSKYRAMQKKLCQNPTELKMEAERVWRKDNRNMHLEMGFREHCCAQKTL